MAEPSRMNVLFLASEADPLIKIGGLGDVAGSLPRALLAIHRYNEAGQVVLDVRLVIPFHPAIRQKYPAPQLVAQFTIHSKDKEIPVKAYLLDLNGLPVYLISGAPIDQETGVYSLDLEADGYKYVFFSLAALQLAQELNWKPDILHANDWHTAAAVYSLALRRPVDKFFSHTTSLLTVHNLPYLGSMTATGLEAFGLPSAEDSDLPSWAQQMALPLGLLAADSIVAVSPGYAREILTEEYGSGLDGFLTAHQGKISGILNGLDTITWDPSTDQALTSRFNINTISDRKYNKSALQAELNLIIDEQVPILAMVTRMDPQKGVDLAVDAVRFLLHETRKASIPFQVVFLGTGNPVLEEAAHQLEQDYPDQARARIKFDEQLSRRIYAGADALLMPSRYEPCGLSQMIAMRYGCVPIAHATGGLRDSIHDPSHSDEPTGFLFEKADAKALVKTIQRALTRFSRYPEEWRQIQINGMQQDFSWNHSAREYITKYKLLVG
ncbi:MAG: starch synthase [Anaerolineales bacterium]|nr:glycogen synthase [Anaerolineae bacterium]PWB53794.1 MAG: starch synthase [Anaerolineales bacterium]